MAGYKKGGDFHMISPQEIKTMGANPTIVYKIFDHETKQIGFVNKNKVENCLAPVREQVMYYNRDIKYSTIQVRFSSVEEARKHSNKRRKR